MQLGQTICRVFQFIFILLTTALIGNAIHEAFSGNPSGVNFAIFVDVFCWVVLFYGLAASFMEGLAMPMLLFALDGIAAILSLIAALVLSAKLGVHSCGNPGYLKSNNYTNGAHDMSKRCHELQASTAFFWFLFTAFLASIAMTFMNRGGSTSMRGGIRKGPSMSTV